MLLVFLWTGAVGQDGDPILGGGIFPHKCVYVEPRVLLLVTPLI